MISSWRQRLSESWSRVFAATVARRRLERDLDDEMSFHLAMRREKVAATEHCSIDPEREAARQFGNRTLLKEQMREMWTFPSIESIWQDIKYAGRALRRQPGFTVVAILLLGAVIGLNASLATVFTALMFHPPNGITDPDRVVSLYPIAGFGEPPIFSIGEYRFLADSVGDRSALDALNFSIAPDVTVLAYAILLAAGSTVLFGLAPALHATRSDGGNALRNRDGLSPGHFPLRNILLAVQVAVSVVVLIGAGLLVRRVQRQSSFDPGFSIANVSVVTFVVQGDSYLDSARTIISKTI